MNIRLVLIAFLITVKCAAGPAQNYYVIDGAYEDNSVIKLWYTMLGLLDDYDNNRCNGFEISFNHDGKYYDASRGPNWWNYFFDFNTVGSVKKGTIVRIPRYQRSIIRFRTVCTMSPERANFLLNKYVKLQPEILAKLEHIKNEYFDQKIPVIGVYYQKPMMDEAQKEWTPSSLINRIREEIKDFVEYKVCLVTEQTGFEEAFKNEFGDRFMLIPLLKNTTQTSRVEKGEHELLTLLSLSLCDVVIAPGSYQGIGAKMINPKLHLIQLDTIPYACE